MKNLSTLKTSSECDLSFRYPQYSGAIDSDIFSALPIILNSNRSICWEATDYILHLFHNKPSLAKSTLNTYANQISRSLRFLEYNKITFSEITDDHLMGPSGLMSFLQSRKHSSPHQPANNNQANKILGRLFELLFFLQDFGHIHQSTISKDAKIRSQINVTPLKHRPRGSTRTIYYYHHPARLPTEAPTKKRPISSRTINTLVDAIYGFTTNEFIRKRWFCLLSTMEWTGARESEISKIMTSSVEDAMHQINKGQAPRLEIKTTKGKNKGRARLIPVPESLIYELYSFINFYRNPLIQRSTMKSSTIVDHGYVFTTEYGLPMRSKRIYDHFKEVRDTTDLPSSEASPHLFRHRFITLHVKRRLKVLLDTPNIHNTNISEFVIKKVKLLTGHVSDSSLWGYVDDAMEELDIFKKIENQILLEDRSVALSRKLTNILSESKSAKSIRAKAELLDEVLRLFQ